MLNKIVANLEANPCTDGTAQCGHNTVCVADGEDGYEVSLNTNAELLTMSHLKCELQCNCKNGFTLTPYASYDGIQNCVDIDECSSANICDENADCFNDPGGYSCRCRNGFSGNGYLCEPAGSNNYPESTEKPDPTLTTPEHYQVSHQWHRSQFLKIYNLTFQKTLQCDQCSEQANCFNGVCVCNDGWQGDGIECVLNCPVDYTWNVDRCVPAVSDDEEGNNTILIELCF